MAKAEPKDGPLARMAQLRAEEQRAAERASAAASRVNQLMQKDIPAASYRRTQARATHSRGADAFSMAEVGEAEGQWEALKDELVQARADAEGAHAGAEQARNEQITLWRAELPAFLARARKDADRAQACAAQLAPLLRELQEHWAAAARGYREVVPFIREQVEEADRIEGIYRGRDKMAKLLAVPGLPELTPELAEQVAAGTFGPWPEAANPQPAEPEVIEA